MSFGFLNALLLAGLAGLALPVLVHLISKRNYDVVNWGAMQFLELGRRTRRRIRVEELLLLLLRMCLVGLLALAVSRPWIKGGVFSQMSGTARRDVALVVDGSYSMGWEGEAVTPQAAAGQWAHTFLEELGGGDSVVLLDARDQVRSVIEMPTGDIGLVRRELDNLPEPSGTSHLAEAAIRAATLLAAGSNLERDIILLSDGQALGWTPGNERVWKRVDDILSSSAIRPRVWAVDVNGAQTQNPANFSVAPLELTRELTVPDFPIRIETSVRQSGGQATRQQVFFEVNGSRLDEKTVSVNVPADGEAAVVFDHRFPRVGSYVVGVSVEADDLPGDNRSLAAVVVETGLPVLLVDGDPQADPTRSETFFLRSALTPRGSKAPWVQATVQRWNEFDGTSLAEAEVVILANVPRLTDEQHAALVAFVRQGGGLIVAPGDRVESDFYNQILAGGDAPLLPAEFSGLSHEIEHPLGDVNIAGDSLEVAWLTRFGSLRGVDLDNARFAHWWKLSPRGAENDQPTADSAAGGDDERPTRTLATLDTGDPLLVSQQLGEGTVLQLAVPLDSDWSTLPARNDFVPFLHEMIFHLASRRLGRNVAPGQPLQLEIDPDKTAGDFLFIDPGGREHAAQAGGDAVRPLVRFADTAVAGVYRCVERGTTGQAGESFVVVSDRIESDLTPLTAEDRARLSAGDRVRFIDHVDEIRQAMQEDESPTELWRWLLVAVLALLVGEVMLTRRLVQGGHVLDDTAVADEPPEPTPDLVEV